MVDYDDMARDAQLLVDEIGMDRAARHTCVYGKDSFYTVQHFLAYSVFMLDDNDSHNVGIFIDMDFKIKESLGFLFSDDNSKEYLRKYRKYAEYVKGEVLEGYEYLEELIDLSELLIEEVGIDQAVYETWFKHDDRTYSVDSIFPAYYFIINAYNDMLPFSDMLFHKVKTALGQVYVRDRSKTNLKPYVKYKLMEEMGA